MPIIILFAPLIAAVAMLPVSIHEEEKVKQVNELCVQKFSTPEEIKSCKTILLKMQ